MVRLLMLAVLLVGCEHGKGGGGDAGGGGACSFMGVVHELGEQFPAGDGCNTCACEPDGVSCTLITCFDAGLVDADPAFCGATGVCPEGPECGAFCCARGEKCESGTCVCGSNPRCADGNSCEAAGPIGGDACGSICCGATGPCPQ